jgi:alpha-mannosidase
MRISAVEPTELFTGTAQRPVQIVRVTVAGDAGSAGGGGRADGGPASGGPGGGTAATRTYVRIEGPGVSTPRPASVAGPEPGAQVTAEVGVELAVPVTEGASRQATAIAEQWLLGPGGAGVRVAATARLETRMTAAVPGWTMWMVSHFHYDPVWWNTQGQFTESRLMLPDNNGEMPAVRTAFELVSLHLEMARLDPDYKFVLAEIDYLKPYFDTHPQRRGELRALLAQGRLEIVGGNYNEANTNLTCAESTIRNAVYGVGFQRDVLGGDPATAWMLDVFGHDPSYPSLMAAAGLTATAWARGPFHQWGPHGTVGDNLRMQFPSEFEWLSPDGGGLLTAYMANHYSAGWQMAQHADLESACCAAYEQFMLLKPVAATRNVLLPVGADHVIPSRWCTHIHRAWNARYLWPRFVTAVPAEFFAAIRADAASRDIAFTPQTRDMNPVYPGKDVSFIDTKQAQRAAETAVMDGERLATLAWLRGLPYPEAALDKAWRQLLFGGHHDAITGTESDQVYLDLLGGWREAFERGDGVRRAAAATLAGLVDTTSPAASAAPATQNGPDGPDDRAIVVFNTLAADRDGMVTHILRCPQPGTGWLTLHDGAGVPVAALAEGVTRHRDGTLAEVTLTWRARGVPPLGYRTYWARPAPPPGLAADGWVTVAGQAIENAVLRVEADPRRGGALRRILDKRTGTELIPAGHGVANELVVQDEYDYHPRWNEGPWLLMPKGPGTGSASVAAQVRAQRCPVGARLVATWSLGDLRVTQETLLWDGADQVEFRTHVDGSIGHDRLLRARFPLQVPGALPVYETAAAVIGRPFGPVDSDVGEHWYTLDNPAYTWFGLSSCVRLIVRDAAGRARPEAIGVAEVVMPDSKPVHNGCRGAVRALIVALARQSVTATCSCADGPRYGAIDLDSNLPDVRIAVGGPEVNAFTARVLAAADPAYAAELARRLAADAAVRLWVPAAQTRAQAFRPGADLRGPRDLPVLILAGADLAAATADLAADLADAAAGAVTPEAAMPGTVVAGAATPGTASGSTGVDSAERSDNSDNSDDADQAAAAVPPAGHRWSVALLNRGTPGSVVTTRGELNIALMRSCSGWPSGVWIDEPKRTAPDGSSFSWQHWSHTFEYALATGAGDWRDAGFTAAGQAYNHPLLARETGIHPGQLPAAGSLLPIEVAGPGSVVLSALKPRGNRAAAGLPGRAGPRAQTDAVTLRLRETSGRPARVRLRVPAGSGGHHPGHRDADSHDADSHDAHSRVPAGRLTNLLEEQDGTPLEADDGGAILADLPPSGMVTLLVVPGPQHPAVAAEWPRELAAEPAQPIFARYWLHGKGPAPAGYLPAAVHISPTRIAVPPAVPPAAPAAVPAAAPAAPPVRLRITVAAGPGPATGNVVLDVPDGLTADPAGPLRYELAAGGFAAWDVAVRTAAATPGRYFLAARISAPDQQALEDVAVIAVGEEPVPPRDTPLDDLLPRLLADQSATAAELAITTVHGADLTLAPGGRGELAVRLVNQARSQIRGEAQLVSPFGTWEVITPWTRGFSIGAGHAVTLRYQVAAPAAARPGSQWWALVKVCHFGRLHYTSAVRVSVSG